MLNGWNIKFCLTFLAGAAIGCSSLIAQDQQDSQQQYTQQQNPNAVPLNAEQQSALQSAQQRAFDEENLRAVEEAAIPEPQRPFEELSPQDSQYLNQILDYWQSTSQNVKQYVCQFRRFEYDSGIVDYRDPNTNQLAAATYATGEIRYAEPDKGYYETDQILGFKAPPTQPGGEAEWEKLTDDSAKEKWICDGSHVYEFDFANRRLYESVIPPEMQGQRIIDSPLPFLFGANKDQILSRYWVRYLPKDSTDEYWLEAYPKRIEDARMYSKIEVILAKEDFLPKAMHVYSPQYNPSKGNFQSRYFAFENRKINGQLSRFQNFLGIFVRPQTPLIGGWERVSRSPLHDDQRASLPTERK